MAVVIRLQGLPIVAGTMDIRHFFSGLTIPDGGVHIVGGEHGEAFIVFATDEDARLGMMRTGGSIKGSKVSLLLSSKTEMQNMIELSRRRFEAGNAEAAAGNSNRPCPPVSTGGSGRGNLPTTAQGFSNTSTTTHTTAAHSAHEPVSNKNVPTFATANIGNIPNFNNFSGSGITLGSTLTTAMASLNSVPPPIPPLPTMQSIPAMPSIAPLPVPPSVSSLPSVPSVSALTAVPPVPAMTHLPHLSALPPFNPGVPPPVGAGLAGAGPPLSLGSANHMFLNPMNFNPLNLQAHLKPPITNPDECYVQLQGLPFTANELQVKEFFQGLSVENVRLIRDNGGRNTGRALVKFFAHQDAFEAVKRGAAMLGQRIVEIMPSSERQWRENGGGLLDHNQFKPGHNAEQDRHRRGGPNNPPPTGRARSRSPHNKSEFCVYLKGLPYEAETKQISDFFKNMAIVDDSIYIAYGPNGRATGEGFVEFKNEADYKSALGCHMKYMGSRFIQVHPVTKKVMFEKIDSIRKRLAGMQEQKNNAAAVLANKDAKICCHISNIPYSSSKKDVRVFLNGIQIFEETLKILTDNTGNGLGQAIVQFRSEEEALKAERLHRQKINGRDAFVHIITYEQMRDIERNPPPQNRRGHKMLGNTHPQPQVQTPAQVQAQVQAHAYPAMTGEEFNFLRNTVGSLANGPPFVTPFTAPGNGLAGPPPLPPLGAALGEVALGVPPPLVGAHLPGPVLEPPGFRPGGTNGPPGFVGGPESLRGMPHFDNGARKGDNHNRGGGGQQGQTGGPQPAFGAAPDSLRGQAGGTGPNNPRPTIVKIQNMPFTVSIDEILDFFYGYQVLPGSVCLQFSEKGLPTGEAMVAFESHEEARAAVMDLNDRPIGARKVKLTMG